MNSMKSGKSSKTKVVWTIVAIVILLSIYPIYFFVVQAVTKNDSLSLFPSQGVWVAEADEFSIEIDLDGESSIVTLTIAEDGSKIELKLSESGGHGTIIWPSATTSILHFTSESLELDSENYVSFSCSKFKFNEDDFYLYKIYTQESNNLSLIKDKTTLHFIEQSSNS